MTALGKHLLIELEGCDPGKLNDLGFVRQTLLAAAVETGSTILGESFHRFSPQGISGVVVIAESHLSIHTWPEHRYAAADVFTCGTRVEPRRGAEYLVQQFQPHDSSITEFPRGIVAGDAVPGQAQAVPLSSGPR